jgi:hypothetical protein
LARHCAAKGYALGFTLNSRPETIRAGPDLAPTQLHAPLLMGPERNSEGGFFSAASSSSADPANRSGRPAASTRGLRAIASPKLDAPAVAEHELKGVYDLAGGAAITIAASAVGARLFLRGAPQG